MESDVPLHTMRYVAKVDANHAYIVNGLRTLGASVQSLAPIGKGCPDILVGYRSMSKPGQGVNVLMEIKNPKSSKSDQKLTEDEERWHNLWSGQVAIVRTLEEAVEVLYIACK